jgi:hypothetical protein
MFKISSIYNNVRMDTSDHGLSHPIKGAGAAVNGLTGIKKYVGEVSVYFKLEMTALGGSLSVRHR